MLKYLQDVQRQRQSLLSGLGNTVVLMNAVLGMLPAGVGGDIPRKNPKRHMTSHTRCGSVKCGPKAHLRLWLIARSIAKITKLKSFEINTLTPNYNSRVSFQMVKFDLYSSNPVNGVNHFLFYLTVSFCILFKALEQMGALQMRPWRLFKVVLENRTMIKYRLCMVCHG